MGPGIATHDLPHHFMPLHRGEPSRNRHARTRPALWG